jgi:hypothetical protein
MANFESGMAVRMNRLPAQSNMDESQTILSKRNLTQSIYYESA